MHSWGDSWPHWDELYAAESWLGKMFERITGQCTYTKEKWGSLRLEYIHLWLNTPERVRLWCELLRKAIRKFPNVAAEITSDAVVTIDHWYWTPWFAGVHYAGKHGSEWRCSKGIEDEKWAIPSVKTVINNQDLNELLFYSFRYALGRTTYAVGDVTALLTKHMHIISDYNKRLMIKEIKKEIKEGRAGMQMDIDEWKKILQELEYTLKEDDK